jgi:hypothetical protein
MAFNCSCPSGTALPDLGNVSCKEGFGQVQKLLIQRIYKTSGVKNKLPKASVTAKETITTFFAASDGTKLLITPFVENPTSEPGAAKTYGSGNQVRNGIPINIGADPTTFTAVLNEIPQSVASVLKKLECEEIGVGFIDDAGNIALSSTDDGANFSVFPVQAWFVSDKKLGGLEEPDSNNISFSLPRNWSDSFTIIKADDLDYNALTDLTNAASAAK